MHYLDHFTHCPHCGSADFRINDERSKRCADCGFVYYHNASASTVAVVIDDRRNLLVCRRALEPAKGTLDLPGGFVDPGETLETGCLRELREETGCEGTIARYLFSDTNIYEYSGFKIHTTDAFFLIKLSNASKIQAMDDAESLFWMPLSEIHPEDFGLLSIRRGVERIISEF